jgi:hypothetical protein
MCVERNSWSRLVGYALTREILKQLGIGALIEIPLNSFEPLLTQKIKVTIDLLLDNRRQPYVPETWQRALASNILQLRQLGGSILIKVPECKAGYVLGPVLTKCVSFENMNQTIVDI